MNAVLRYYVFLILLSVLLACSKDDIEETTSFNNLAPFKEILIKDVFHVYLKQDTVYSINVVGNRDFIEGVVYQIENDTLTISNKSKRMWLSPKENKVKLYISANRLKEVWAEETCYIETINAIISDEFGIVLGYKLNMANIELNCNTFYFWNESGGELRLRGNVNYLKLWNFAMMSVEAGNLTADYALVENYSKGDCKVFVRETLEYSIYGEGDIYLLGEPNQIILKERTSSGRLIQIK